MKVSFLIPCYNEEENVVPMSEAIIEQMATFLPTYDYDILFIDNCSTDKTRPLLEELCANNKKIKAIFNARNFGQFNSPFYGMCQTDGDCTISMCCDFQDPVEIIPSLVKEWEKGYKIVCAVKSNSKENKLVRFFRSIYYKLIKKHSDVEQIEHFTGTGLYDKSFIEVLKSLDDPTPFLRGIVAELGYKRVEVPYEQQKRRAGKTKNNFGTLYDAAMLSFTTYTKLPVRLAMGMGIFFGILSVLGGITSIILHALKVFDMTFWGLVCVVGFFAAINLVFISVIGEYVLNVKSKISKRPLVIEEKRLNFDKDEKKD
ncbi:MAG: glycosyltransferase family 2 protein [Clostridiales bacterium]|nr:glycosyltransferase family 2 protein [Clostridiales bacterium]